MGDKYRYADLPLLPNLFAEIAIELFAGRMAKRDELADAVRQHHISHGGKEPNSSLSKVAKQALNTLQRQGRASKTGARGLWRIISGTLPPAENVEIPETVPPNEPELDADEIVGSGNELMYAYTYRTYQRYANDAGQKRYQIKIGYSQSSSLTRVTDQTGTALPEYPLVLLVIRCDDSRLLETAVHTVLELRGFAIDDSPGTEWFSTSPEEIKEIWRLTLPPSAPNV